MMAAVESDARERTGAVRWTLRGNRSHLWDRERQLVRVRPPWRWASAAAAQIFAASLLGIQALDFRKKLPQEQHLVSVLWAIGMLFGLNDRFEFKSTHTKLRDVKYWRSLYEIMIGEVLAHRA